MADRFIQVIALHQIDAELAQQGKDNEVRIARLEELIRNIGVVELVRQLEQINGEMARLRGQIEVLANENQQVQKRQRDFYLDLDSRLKRLEGGGAQAAPAATAAPVRTSPTTCARSRASLTGWPGLASRTTLRTLRSGERCSSRSRRSPS